MILKSQKYIYILLTLIFLISDKVDGVEIDVKGLVELDYSVNTDNQANTFTSIESFLEGNYGKFSTRSGSTFSISQAALSFDFDWESNLSASIVTNGYLGGAKNGLGITEA